MRHPLLLAIATPLAEATMFTDSATLKTKVVEWVSDRNCCGAQIEDWDVSQITDMSGPRDTYGNALGGFFPTDFNGDISKWDTASVTTFDLTVRDSPLRLARAPPPLTASPRIACQFKDATSFNADIGRWDTAKATCFNSVFNEAQKFNRDLDWDTAKVITFDSLVSAARRRLCRASPPPLIPSRRPAAVPSHH